MTENRKQYYALLSNKIIMAVDDSPESLNQNMLKMRNSSIAIETDVFEIVELTETAIQESIEATIRKYYSPLIEFLDFFGDREAETIRKSRDNHRAEYIERYRRYLGTLKAANIA